MNTVTKKKLVNNTAEILEKSGYKQILYNTLISVAQFRALGRLRKISNHVAYESPTVKKKIVFHCLHSYYVSSIFKEAAIAKALQIMGHDVTMLICGGKLYSCTGMFNINVPPNKGMCHNCVRFGIELFDILGLPYITYPSFIHEDMRSIEESCFAQIQHNKDYFGVDVDFHARSSTARYFKGEKLYDEEIYKQKLANAVIATTVAKLYDQVYNPDIIVTSHGCYAEWGSFADYFKNQGKKVYTWYTGYNHRSLVFDLINIDTDYNRYKRIHGDSLSDKEQTELQTYLDKRREGTDDTSQYDFIKKATYVCNSGNFERTFVLYPNLPWDVDPTCLSDFCDDVYDWVEKTIILFTKFPQYQLIIKTHPAEKLFRSRNSVYDFIMDKYTKLPSNIFVVNPDENMSPYSLFEYTDVGIIANGTTGLEMVLNDIPTIVVGHAHYRGKGFTYDASTLEEYINLLFYNEDIKKGIVKNKKERNLYSYYYFIKSFIPFPILRHRNFLDIGYNAKLYEDFVNDYELSHIAKCIVENGIMQKW